MKSRNVRHVNIRPLFASLLFVLFFIGTISAAVPAAFTYQGSLKQNGVPVNATSSIEIRLTNADGTQTYWTNGVKSVQVKEGLYRIELTPTGINWNTATPYIETRVNNVVLLPREKLTSTPYALVAKELAADSTIQGNVTMGGTVLQPKQPAFLANASSGYDITGNETLYTVAFKNEITDQAGNYDPTTYVFKAPITGVYLLSAQVNIVGWSPEHKYAALKIVTTKRLYSSTIADIGSLVNRSNMQIGQTLNITVLADMAANDTAKVTLEVIGGTKTIDLLPNEQFNFFSGTLIN